MKYKNESASSVLMKYLKGDQYEVDQIISILHSIIYKYNEYHDPKRSQSHLDHLSMDDIPSDELIRLDKFIPTDLVNLPELKEVWHNVKTVLVLWKSRSWRNRQRRRARQKYLKDNPRIFFNPDRYYLALVLQRFVPNFPKDILRNICSYLPPIFYGRSFYLHVNKYKGQKKLL